MAAKQLGEFSSKFTTLTISPGPAGSILIQGNSEGTVTGFGTILTTATFVGAKSGTYGSTGFVALDNGDSLAGSGSGTFDTVGKHRWRTQGCLEMSDGRKVITEGELDLADRSWNCRLFEN
jgi:hypothetical protein